MFTSKKVKSNAEIMKNLIAMKGELLKSLEKVKEDIKLLEAQYNDDMARLRKEMTARDLLYVNNLDALEMELESLEKSLKFVEDISV